MKPHCVIIGGGPTAMTIAWKMSAADTHSITIIESANSLGGCHRVNRVDGEFSEHGPRVYSTSMVNFRAVLHEMARAGYATDPNKIFTEYSKLFQGTFAEIFALLTMRERATFAAAFLFSSWQLTESVGDFMRRNNFSAAALSAINTALLATDGAGIDNYSMYKFFQLANQEGTQTLLQPVRPNDVGFIGEWQRALVDRGVNIVRGRVISVGKRGDIYIINTTAEIFTASMVICAIPPQSLQRIAFFDDDRAADPFNLAEMAPWIRENSYSDYISITFSWKNHVALPQITSLPPASAHGLLQIPLSQYFLNSPGTIISTALSKPGALIQASREEKIAAAWIELRQLYGPLPQYDVAIVGSDTIIHPAYVRGVKYPYAMPMQSSWPRVFTVGPHTNTSGYAFTSIEAAVTSALKFVGDTNIRTAPTLCTWMLLILVIIIIFLVAAMWYTDTDTEKINSPIASRLIAAQ